MVITYRHRPKPKRSKAQPAKVTGPAIVRARKPSEYHMEVCEPPDDPQADKRVRAFFTRMGLTLPPEQN
jgi:hypothetical protein